MQFLDLRPSAKLLAEDGKYGRMLDRMLTLNPSWVLMKWSRPSAFGGCDERCLATKDAWQPSELIDVLAFLDGEFRG